MDINHTGKNRYGTFRNVYLTEEEYRTVIRKKWENRLESMSEWKYRRALVDFPKKTDFERLKTWK